MEESNNDNGQAEKGNEIQGTEEKQSNKLFTQSETDQIVSKQIAKYKAELEEKKAMESELLKYRENEKKRSEAEMSEIELRDKKIAEIEQARIESEKQLFEYKKKDTLSNILNDAKYAKLPKAYKKLVEYSDNVEEIMLSADNALKEFEQDFGGEVKQTFGIANTNTDPIKTVRAEITDSDDFKNAIKANMASKLKQRGY